MPINTKFSEPLASLPAVTIPSIASDTEDDLSDVSIPSPSSLTQKFSPAAAWTKELSKVENKKFADIVAETVRRINTSPSDETKLCHEISFSDIGKQARREMLLSAACIRTMYNDTLVENLGKTKLQSNVISLDIPEEILAEYPTLEKQPDGRLCDPDLGLVMQAFDLPDEEESPIVFAIGGTTAGPEKGEFLQRNIKNPKFVIRQWQTNLEAMSSYVLEKKTTSNSTSRDKTIPSMIVESLTNYTLRGNAIPKAFNSLSALIGKLKIHFSGRKIIVAGHSQGGENGAYAALKERVNAICFGAPPFGDSLTKDVLETLNLQQDRNNIMHYFTTGDRVPLTGISSSSTHIGQICWIEPDPTISQKGPLATLWNHDQFLESVVHMNDKYPDTDSQSDAPRQDENSPFTDQVNSST